MTTVQQRLLMGLWIVLIILTVVTVFIGSFSWERIIQTVMFEEDPALSIMFLFMGIFPFIFIYSTWLFQVSLTPSDWLNMWLGFVVGSFAVVPVLSRMQQFQRRSFAYDRTMWTALILFTGLLFISGLIKGNMVYLINLLFVDSFVTIMTFDFLVFYGASIILAFRTSYRPWWSLIPLVGYLIAQYPSRQS